MPAFCDVSDQAWDNANTNINTLATMATAFLRLLISDM
jgi:hypothetical protein